MLFYSCSSILLIFAACCFSSTHHFVAEPHLHWSHQGSTSEIHNHGPTLAGDVTGASLFTLSAFLTASEPAQHSAALLVTQCDLPAILPSLLKGGPAILIVALSERCEIFKDWASPIPFPILYTSDSTLIEMATRASTESFVVDVTLPSKPMDDVQVTVIDGVLRGAGSSLPTLVVTASYDSFTVAPSLSGDGGSGVAALLETVRILSDLYSNPQTQPAFNVMFMLSGGGRQDFAGTRQWLSHLDPHLDITFALCLDSLGEPGPLELHASRLPKQDAATALHKSFATAASSIEAGLETILKKIDLSKSDVYWEHEQFSRRQIPSMTLTRQREPQMARKRIDAYTGVVDIDTLGNSTWIAVSGLVSHMLGLEDPSVLGGVFDLVSEDQLVFWLNTMNANSPRLTPFVTDGFVSFFEHVFREYLTDVHIKTRPLNGGLGSAGGAGNGKMTMAQAVATAGNHYKFYGPLAVKGQLYTVSSASFDLIICCGAIVYLVVIYVALRGVKLALGDVKKFAKGE